MMRIPLALLAACLAPLCAQDKLDAFKFAVRKVLSPALDEGTPIRVTDGETGEPLAGAIVLVGAPWTARLHDERKALFKRYPEDLTMASLALAVHFGRKWTTNENGQVLLPPRYPTLFVIAGDRFADFRRSSHLPDTIRLYPRAWVAVEVVDADGEPMPRATVVLEVNGHAIHRSFTTNGEGQTRVELPYKYRNTKAKLALAVQIPPMEDTARNELNDAHWKSTETVRLKLREIGYLHITAPGIDGALRQITLASVQVGDGKSISVWGNDRSEVRFPVGLGHHLQITGHMRHHMGFRLLKVTGPNRANQVMPIKLDAHAAKWAYGVRLIDKRGQALRYTRVLLQEEGHMQTRTDDQGRLWILMNRKPWRDRLVLRAVDESGSLGAVSIELPEEPLGYEDLGEQQLGAEPLLVGGVVVDAQGKPVAGAYIWRRSSNSPEMSPDSTTTDAAGRFELHMLDPVLDWIQLGITHPDFKKQPRPLSDGVSYEVGRNDLEIGLTRR